MPKHKLIRLSKIIQERIGSLSEEVETAKYAKLNPLYIVDRKDEIESLQWATRILRWVLDRAVVSNGTFISKWGTPGTSDGQFEEH